MIAGKNAINCTEVPITAFLLIIVYLLNRKCNVQTILDQHTSMITHSSGRALLYVIRHWWMVKHDSITWLIRMTHKGVHHNAGTQFETTIILMSINVILFVTHVLLNFVSSMSYPFGRHDERIMPCSISNVCCYSLPCCLFS